MNALAKLSFLRSRISTMRSLTSPCAAVPASMQPVVGAGARPAHLWTCVTKFEPFLVSARIGQGLSRERGAQGVAVRVHRVTHYHRPLMTRPQRPWRQQVGVGHLDCGRWRRCFWDAVGKPVSMKGWAYGDAFCGQPSSVPRRTAVRKVQRSGRSLNARTSGTHEALRTKSGRHRPMGRAQTHEPFRA